MRPALQFFLEKNTNFCYIIHLKIISVSSTPFAKNHLVTFACINFVLLKTLMVLISIACAIVQCFIQTAGAQMKKKIASTRVVVRLLPDAPEWQKINSLRLPLTNDYTWENSSFSKPFFFGCTHFCSIEKIFRSMSHTMDFSSKHTLVIAIRQFSFLHWQKTKLTPMIW